MAASRRSVALPIPAIAAQAVDGAVEPLVLAAPQAGTSGELRVRKPVHDALAAAVQLPHVSRVSASFAQGVNGARMVSVRLILDESFPLAPADTLAERLTALSTSAKAACAGVLGASFVVFVDFGGKRLR